MSYILLVEDNQENANMMIRLLQSVGYEVRHFVLGARAMPAARQERPALILMDFNLPDIDGRTLALIMKKQLGEAEAPPVIAVTARTGIFEEAMAEHFGCDAFLRKPFEPEEFLNLVAQFVPLPTLTKP